MRRTVLAGGAARVDRTCSARPRLGLGPLALGGGAGAGPDGSSRGDHVRAVVDAGASVMGLLEDQCRLNGAALIVITHDMAVAARARTQYRLESGVLSPILAQAGQRGARVGLDAAAAGVPA